MKNKDNVLDTVAITNEAELMIEKIEQVVVVVADKTKFEDIRINDDLWRTHYMCELIFGTCYNITNLVLCIL